MFNERGFDSWKRAMLIAFSTKGKLFSIDGILTRLGSIASNLKKWIKCTDMVMAWILNVVVKNIRDNIIYAKYEREMWIQLEERYG